VALRAVWRCLNAISDSPRTLQVVEAPPPRRRGRRGWTHQG
jgi:hypothetical protein